MVMNPGDLIYIKTKDDEFEGTLMPSADNTHTIIKLSNGYNVGIDKNKIQHIELKSPLTKKQIKKLKYIPDKNLKKILLLHTGGTIASKIDYSTGGVYSQFTPQEIINMFPELKKIATIDSKLIFNISSENINLGHYNILVDEIKKAVDNDYAGIIITHGTDTLHYTSAVLSFLVDVSIPIILVGAQRSSDRGSSDAALNLISAAYYISNNTKSFKNNVGICMHASSNDDYCFILSGVNARKMHTSRRDAFRPINILPLAKVNYKKQEITYFNDELIKKKDIISSRFDKLNIKIKVGIIKIYPSFDSNIFDAYKNYDALVIESTGLGHIPILSDDDLSKNNLKIKEKLKQLSDVIIVLSPQTIYGRLNLNVYSPGRELKKMNILGHLSNMTTETTFAKLHYLLSNFKKNEVRKLISQDLKGELPIRDECETYLF